jgi:tRNA-splicing ligase RtcB
MQRIETRGAPINLWVDGVPVEPAAMEQLKNTAALPFVWPHLAVMPDCQFGMGATVGSVVPTLGCIIPAAVGVDIGCGMSAVLTDLKEVDAQKAFKAISAAVPHGRSHDGQEGDKGAWHPAPENVHSAWVQLLEGYHVVVDRHPRLDHPFHLPQLGTLGTGNHFIEVSLDEDHRVWVVLHSGSRGPGNRIGTYFIKLAKEAMEKWHIKLVDPNLAYLPQGESLFTDYLAAVHWAQRYAKTNRQLMMDAVLDALGAPTTMDSIDCHHNYVAQERHFGKDLFVTRKGAVSAKLGEWGIIPGSMGAKSFIVKGKGNRESLTSCSHGAGRAMSRTRALKEFTVADHAKATEGVVCRKDAEVLDETPGAYKSIDAVMAAQTDLVEVVHTLKQVVSVKG